MPYKSNKPTKEKRNLFNFIERNKASGSVSSSRLGKYVNNNGLSVERHKGFKNHAIFSIKNNRGNMIGNIALNKRKRIDWWIID
jgi:hypothetical protein